MRKINYTILFYVQLITTSLMSLCSISLYFVISLNQLLWALSPNGLVFNIFVQKHVCYVKCCHYRKRYSLAQNLYKNKKSFNNNSIYFTDYLLQMPAFDFFLVSILYKVFWITEYYIMLHHIMLYWFLPYSLFILFFIK